VLNLIVLAPGLPTVLVDAAGLAGTSALTPHRHATDGLDARGDRLAARARDAA
jgi:hypothetical protein